MKKTHIAIIAGVAAFAALAVAMAVIALIYQSTRIKDAYFNLDSDNLREVPANLVALRPTHFPVSDSRICHYDENDSLARTVGRNVFLRQAIAEAYDCAPAQVVLPSDAPKGRFDFLVTTSSDTRAQLRKAIQNKLNYIARRETQNTDVFVLKVSDPALPGLAVSSDNETSDINYDDGKLYFTHEPAGAIVDGLSQGLHRPVLDQTALTNAYDFSVAWNRDVMKRMENGAWNLARTREVLAGWGLTLDSSNVPVEMYVVTDAP